MHPSKLRGRLATIVVAAAVALSMVLAGPRPAVAAGGTPLPTPVFPPYFETWTTDGIGRRNKAIKLLQDWAAAQGRTVQVVYTLPTTPAGLDSSSLAVLQNAIANGVRIDFVNIMTFDYYDRATTDMGAAVISAAQG